MFHNSTRTVKDGSDNVLRFGRGRADLMLAACAAAMVAIAETRPVEAAEAMACRTRDAMLQPFTRSSPWNAPIGTNAKYKDMPLIRSEQGTVNSLHRSGPQKGVNYGANIATGRASDPRVTVAHNGSGGGTNLPLKTRMPKGFYNTDPKNTGCDCSAVIHDATTGKTYDFWRFQDWKGTTTSKLPNNQRLASVAKSVDIRGKGYNPTTSTKACVSMLGGTRATGMSRLAGLLRGAIANKPGEPIGHALAIGLTARQLGKTRVQPASCMDSTHENNTGNIPYGAVFAIPPVSKGGCNIDKMGLSEPGKRLAVALRDFGAIVSDRRGSGVSIGADQYLDDTVRNQLKTDFTKLLQCVKMVTNYDPNTQQVKGGGNAIAPVCGNR